MNESFRRAAFLAVLAGFIALWIVVNPGFVGYKVGEIYTLFAVLVIVVYLSAAKLGLGKFLVGVDGKIQERVVQGAMWGVGFILLASATNFSIGIPNLPAALEANLSTLIILVLAPVLEELAFRGVLLGALDKMMSWITAALITAAGFSFFHLTSYGTAMSGAFLGAFFFGIAAAFITKKYQSLVPAIIMHATMNAWILSRMVVAGV